MLRLVTLVARTAAGISKTVIFTTIVLEFEFGEPTLPSAGSASGREKELAPLLFSVLMWSLRCVEGSPFLLYGLFHVRICVHEETEWLSSNG